VAGEVTLALLLLSGTGLMVRTFINLQHADPGFEPERLLKFHLTLWQDRYRTPETQIDYFRQVVDRLRRLPGVQHTAAIINPPLSESSWGRGYVVENRPPPLAGSLPVANYRVATPGYFATMGIPLVAGRDFTEADTADRARVVIIDATLARTFFPNEDPLGRRLKFGLVDSPEPWCEIVGVVGDVKHHGLDQPVRPGLYVPYQQAPHRFMSVVLRTAGPDPLAVVSAVRHELGQIDGEVVVADVRSMADTIARTYWHKRFFSQVLTIFSLIALALAAVGVGAVVGYTVAQRTHEIGVRLALGAQRGQVVRLVVLRAMAPVGLGLVAGLVASGALMRVMVGQLYGVNPLDPGTFLGSAVVLGIMGLVACYLPAHQATRVDPMAALRAE
jgi:putative ABC transport system permease protein